MRSEKKKSQPSHSIETQHSVVFVPGERLAVFSVKAGKNGSVWVRVGSAFINKDGSINTYLDVLPLDGTLHMRRALTQQ